MIWLPYLFFAGTVLLLLTGVVQTVKAPKDPVQARLHRMEQLTPQQRLLRDGVKLEREAARDEEERASRKKKDLLPTVGRMLGKQYWYEKLESDLSAARSPWKAKEILAACWATWAFFGILGFFVFRSFFGFVITLPSFAAPWIMVKIFSGRFIRKFESQLADTLATMANALRAGYSYMQTVELVSREALPPMGDEFKIMMQEMQVGITPEQSLLNFADRVKSSDVELMVTAVIIQRRVGGALAEILDTIAKVIRDRVKLRGQIQTLTAQGRLTGGMLSLMPIFIGGAVTFMGKMTGGTNYMILLTTTTPGKYMILAGLIMQFIGFLAIRKVTTIEM